MQTWEDTPSSEKVGTVVYTWVPTNEPDLNITFEIGTRICLISKLAGWYYAVVQQGSSYIYFTIPCNYLKIITPTKERSKKHEDIYYEEDLNCQLIHDVLIEWTNSLKNPLTAISIDRLIILIKELISIKKVMKTAHYAYKIVDIIKLINEGNKMFMLDYIPMIDGRIVDLATDDFAQIIKSHAETRLETISMLRSPSRLETRSGDKQTEGHHHLFVSVTGGFCEISEPSIWVCGIYDADNDAYITDKFIINVKGPMSINSSFPTGQNALFEINNSNIKHKLYFFVKIYRIGNLTSERKYEACSALKRPFGFAAFSFKDIRSISSEVPIVEKIPILICEEYEFGGAERSYHKDSIPAAKTSMSFGYSIEFCMKYFNSSLQTIKDDHPEIFKDDIYPIPYVGMPDVFDPDRVQNAFFLTLKSANFEKFNFKGKQMNVEATVSVWTTQGQLISNCIRSGHGKNITPETEYKTPTLYHVNSPVWNDTISLVFNSQKLENHQILIIFKHISSNAGKSKIGKITQVGFTVIKLKKIDNTIIHSSDISYYLKKIESGQPNKGGSMLAMDDVKKINQVLKERYSALETTPDDNNKFSANDILKVKARLYSTSYTSNADVFTLKESKLTPQTPDIRKLMGRFSTVDSVEITKFLIPIFQNIVGLMLPSTNYLEDSVYFQALAKILALVHEPRFVLYKATLKRAIQSTKMPMCWKYLTGTIIESGHNILDISTKVFFENVRAFIENLSSIFKVVIKSYQDYKIAFPNKQDNISDELVTMFDQLFPILSADSISFLIPLYIKTLEKFKVVITNSEGIFEYNQIGQMVSSLLFHTLSYSSSVTSSDLKINSVISAQVKFLNKIINCELFTKKEFRDIMCPVIVKNIEKYIHSEAKSVEICVDVAQILTGILRYSESNENKDIRTLLIELITYFMELIEKLDDPSYIQDSKSTTVLLSLLSLMSKNTFIEYFNMYDDDKKAMHLAEWYRMFYSVFYTRRYDMSHAVEWAAIGRVVLFITRDLSLIICSVFDNVRNESSRSLLLTRFFDFVLEFINFPRMSPQNIVNLYLIEYLYSQPDMRLEMAMVMIRVWDTLGHDDLAHLYDYSKPLVVSSLIDIPQLRAIMFKILYDFLIYDFESSGSMDKVTRIIVSYIDSDTYTHDRYQAFSRDFKKCMEKLWEKVEDQAIQKVGLIATSQIIEIIDTMAFYSLPEKFENCVFLQAFRCQQMIEYHTRIGHNQMLQVNIAQLLRSNLIMDAYTEAAICFVRLAESYEWDFTTQLPQLVIFEASTGGDRKESFLTKSIDYFEKGFNLEMAIESCKQLIPLYEIHRIDYIKLSQLHKKISDLIIRIAKGESSIDNYYRINFVGKDFPQSIQNKSLICHMGSCATLGNIISLLKKYFPNATIPVKISQDDKLGEKNVQYIFLQVYQPIPKDKILFEKYYEASETISRFYKNARVNRFEAIVPVDDKKADPSQQNLYFVRTSVKVNYDLPNVVMVAPISEEIKANVSEFEQNMELVKSNADELTDLCRNYLLNPLLLKNIQMKLSGCLNAFVNGGLSMILPKYFNDEFVKEDQNNSARLDKMREVLANFMVAIASSMKLLVLNVPDEMTGFVVNLFESYQLTRQSLLQKAHVESEELSYLLQPGTTPASQPSSGYSSAHRGSSTQHGSSHEPTQSGSSSRTHTEMMPEATKKEKSATVKGFRHYKSSKTHLVDELQKERSTTLHEASIEKLNISDSRDNILGDQNTLDRNKKKFGLFHFRK